MKRVNVLLDEDLDAEVSKAAKSAKVSKSKWIARVVEEKVNELWPDSVVELAGAWKHLPTAKELRAYYSADVKREPL